MCGPYQNQTGAAPDGVNPMGTLQPVLPDRTNLESAQAEMKLTPQERALYERHLGNVSGPGGVDHPDGSRSTLYQMSSDHDGRVYNVPTVWNGIILHPDDAWREAVKSGLHNFPSYGSTDEAEARYNTMHGYMERDMNPQHADAVRVSGQSMGRTF